MNTGKDKEMKTPKKKLTMKEVIQRAKKYKPQKLRFPGKKKGAKII